MCGNGVSQISGSNVHSIKESHDSSCINGGSFKGRSVSLVQDIRQFSSNGSVIKGFTPEEVNAYRTALMSLSASNESEVELKQPKSLKARQVAVTSNVMAGVVESTRDTAAFMKKWVELDPIKNKAAIALRDANDHFQGAIEDLVSTELPKAMTKPTTVNSLLHYGSYGLNIIPGVNVGHEPQSVLDVQKKVEQYNQKQIALSKLTESLVTGFNSGTQNVLDSQHQVNANALKKAVEELEAARDAVTDEITKHFSSGKVPDSITALLGECQTQKEVIKSLDAAVEEYQNDLQNDVISTVREQLSAFQKKLPDDVKASVTSLSALVFYCDIFDSMANIGRKQDVKDRLVTVMASQDYQPDLPVLGKMLSHFLKAELVDQSEELVGSLAKLPMALINQAAKERVSAFIEEVLIATKEKVKQQNLDRDLLLTGQEQRVIDSRDVLKETLSQIEKAENGVTEENLRLRTLEFLQDADGLGDFRVDEVTENTVLQAELAKFKEHLEVSVDDTNPADALSSANDLLDNFERTKPDNFKQSYGEMFQNILAHREGLYGLVKKEPEQYHMMLQAKVEALSSQKKALNALLMALSSQNKPQLTALFNKQLQEVTSELAQTQLFASVVTEIKLTANVRAVGNQNLDRLEPLEAQLKEIGQEIKSAKAKINLQMYLEQLPLLRANNKALLVISPSLVALEKERAELFKQHIRAYPNGIENSLKKVTEQSAQDYAVFEKENPPVVKPERGVENYEVLKSAYDQYELKRAQCINGSLQALTTLSPKLGQAELKTLVKLSYNIESLKVQVKAMDAVYAANLLKLKESYIQVMQNGGFPDGGGYLSLDAWKSWTTQNVLGDWGQDYRPSFEQLVLERQLAKNGMTSINQALYQLGVTMTSSGKASLPGEPAPTSAITQSLQDLYHWAQKHPSEAAALGGSLSHAYSIIASGGGSFGQQLEDMANNVWSKASIENQVKDLLVGEREILPSVEQLAMTPEMIALLYLASAAPYVANAAQGLVEGNLFSGVIGKIPGVSGLSKMALGGMAGILQTKAEVELAKKVSNNREREVMISGIMTAVKTQGTMTQRMDAMKSYVASREIMVQVGTRVKDIQEVGTTGMLDRLKTDVKNWWSFSTAQAKVLAVSTAIVTGGIAASVVAGAVLLTLGTGGLPFAIAGAVGLVAAISGPFASGILMKYAATVDFLGGYGFDLKATATRVKQAMTLQRIGEATKKLQLTKNEETVLGFNIARFKEDNVAIVAKETESKQVEKFQALLQAKIDERIAQEKEKKSIADRTLVSRAHKQGVLNGMNVNMKEQDILAEIQAMDIALEPKYKNMEQRLATL
ncbi:hypothetical protein [uncultured Shewanella sp.]|uniref:hypothetical protein n=1 Tax=uncultured Shewanella sp. TaxID=173975 RepID=UPI002638E4A7|nr:hypothetical protein [uncultured Shewanella sp.]